MVLEKWGWDTYTSTRTYSITRFKNSKKFRSVCLLCLLVSMVSLTLGKSCTLATSVWNLSCWDTALYFWLHFVFSFHSFLHLLAKSGEKRVISLQFKGKMDDNRATRAVTEYQSLHQRFIINSKNYSLQYSHLYIVRLAQMRKSLR